MFKPRHNYKSPITYRYRGKAKGCPVFNNINEITSSMVEQHEECLECLAKIKNRNDLYKTLAENNKPSNNVIKSLQRLSSSASNNRLKTCLQFLIIKVNEKSSTTAVSKQAASNGNDSLKATTPSISTDTSQSDQIPVTIIAKHSTKRQKLYHNQMRSPHVAQKQHNSQLASPPQDQVSSTQDQVETLQDDQDCQTSPMLPNTTEINELDHELPPNETTPSAKDEDDQQAFIKAQSTQSSPRDNYASSAVATMTTSSTSPIPFATSIDACSDTPEANSLDKTTASTSTTTTTTTTTETTTAENLVVSRRNTQQQQGVNSDNETSSIPSWSSVASYGGTSPPSPLSTASSTSSSDSESSQCSSPSSPSTLSRANSPLATSPMSSPDITNNELRGPRLKLSEDKIRKIKRRPVLFIDEFFDAPERQSSVSFSSTPTASSGCSPGQQSTASLNSDLTQSSSSGFSSLTTSNMVVHMFQAPPAFVNTLKLSCNLPPATKTQEPSQTSTPPTTKVELLNCAICGIRDRPPNISKMYGQNSCLLCTQFFVTFLKNPEQLYCAQDGDCLMTFDSRCQACWVKVCLQKFEVDDEEHRKIGQKYSPKLLSIKYK